MSFRKAHTLFRPQASALVDGYWVVPGFDEIAITASIQPATGKDMDNVPEGKRHRAIVAVFTDTEIKTAEQATSDTDPGTNPDEIERNGHRYEAVHAEDWDNDVINHDHALFARKD